MTRRLPLLLRYLRMLVACAVLGVLPARANAPVSIDTVAWVAPTIARADAREARREDTARAAHAALSPRIPPVLRVVHRAPPRARVLVVHRRLYLKHAALLC